MSDYRNSQHFNEPKRLNTKIKHYLLTQTLKTSVSIANSKCMSFKENSKKIDNVYTYIDLFAGAGTFEDKSKGSPLLAYDILEEQYNSNINKFQKLIMACTEKDNESYKKLENVISSYITKDDIECYTGSGCWETYKQDIEDLLKQSGWGFIFADPFSTELNIVELIKTLKSYSNLKDILVFFNFNTLARQDGRKCNQDVERICKTLGINEQDLLDCESNFSTKFETKIKEHFKDLKKFVVGVGFPTTIKGDLINADYFYLIFSTNTPVLVDAFLEAYEEMLCQYTYYNGNQQMPLWGSPDKNYIYDVIKNFYSDGCSLYDLHKHLTDKFLSWKELTKTTKKVPTLKNVISILNEFYNEGSITFIAPDKILYKKNIEKNYKGNLKYSEAKNSADIMKNIFIKLTTR